MANASLHSCTTGERHFLALFSKFETTFRISFCVRPFKRHQSWHSNVFFPSKKQPQYWIFTITLLACNHNYYLLSIIKAIKKHKVVRVVSLILYLQGNSRDYTCVFISSYCYNFSPKNCCIIELYLIWRTIKIHKLKVVIIFSFTNKIPISETAIKILLGDFSLIIPRRSPFQRSKKKNVFMGATWRMAQDHFSRVDVKSFFFFSCVHEFLQETHDTSKSERLQKRLQVLK